jgi:hypothetical protein
LDGKTSTTANLVWDNGSNNGGLPILDYRILAQIPGGEQFVVIMNHL